VLKRPNSRVCALETSSVYPPRAYEGSGPPRRPGNEDGFKRAIPQLRNQALSSDAPGREVTVSPPLEKLIPIRFKINVNKNGLTSGRRAFARNVEAPLVSLPQ
jgi:hypothetical protein